MKCNHIVELFDSYLKGTATSQESSALEQHIATCETCRKQLELYRIFFADVNIENDFPVPPQLDAKIKYAVYQAKSTKKVPFWQNKRILSAATACAFLFVVGIFGASRYSKIKEAAQVSNPQLVQTVDFSTGETDSNDVVTAEPEDVAQIPTQEQILNDAAASEKTIPEESNNAKPQKEEKVSPKATEKPKSSSKVVAESAPKATPKPNNTQKTASADTNTATKAAPDVNTKVVATEAADTPKTVSEKATDSAMVSESGTKKALSPTPHPTPQSTQKPMDATIYSARGISQENTETDKNIVIADQWKEPILANFPHQAISNDTYLVTITKTELEAVLGYPTDANAGQSQLTLQFDSPDQ